MREEENTVLAVTRATTVVLTYTANVDDEEGISDATLVDDVLSLLVEVLAV